MHGYPKDNSKGGGSEKNAAQLIRDEFSRRLYSAIIERGWTQSEIVRRSAGVLTRDNVSTYVTGKVLPTPSKLTALAKALEVEASELLPQAHEVLKQAPTPLNAFSFSEVAPGKVRLQVNKIVKLGTAMKIGQMINDDDAEAAN